MERQVRCLDLSSVEHAFPLDGPHSLNQFETLVAELLTKLLVWAVLGGVLASTWIGRTLGHAEETAILVKPAVKKLVANDDNYALAA